MAERDGASIPDLAAGVELGAVPASGLLAGKVGEEDVLLVRGTTRVFAVGAKCTHLGAPLAKGMVVGDAVRCPWHHACFNAETGEATVAPAFQPLARWGVETRNGRVAVRDRLGPPGRPPRPEGAGPVVVAGAGAGGFAVADALVRLGYAGPVTMVGQDPEAPYDRTLLSKDFLDGKAGEDKLPIEGEGLAERGVDLRLGVAVEAIERETKRVRLADGTTLPYASLVLATGSEPRRLTVPGADLPHVLTLRTAADARAILARAAGKSQVVVAGGSFIGLEAAASLRERDCPVAVVAPGEHPFGKVFGPDLSDAILAVHRKHGTVFHLGQEIVRIDPHAVTLDNGTRLPADLVVVGIGVTPRVDLARAAGLAVDDGVVVDEHLRTSDRAIFAVGDIARWPDPHGGERIRVEHWDVAVRQGQAAALTIAGEARRFDAVPFFWTKHFDLSVRYLGHASGWDEARLDGDPARRDAEVAFRKGGREVALATVDRDLASLAREVEMERRLSEAAASLPL